MDNSYRTTQQDEKIAIEAIFGDDAVFSKCSSKMWTPIDVIIHLEPFYTGDSSDGNVYVFADLRIICSETYPDRFPNLSIEKSKGIAQNDLKELLQNLNRKSSSLLGKCMILELCDEVRKFLHERNKPPAGSFHDGMIRNKMKLGVQTEHQRARSEIREREAVIEERERQKFEYEWRKDVEKTEPVTNPHCRSKDGVVRNILGRKVLVSNESEIVNRNLHPLCMEWLGYVNDEHVLISEWSFQHKMEGSLSTSSVNAYFSSFLRKCQEIIAIGDSLCKLYDVEQTLVPYAFVLVDNNSTSKKLDVKIYVAQKIVMDERFFFSDDCIRECGSSIRLLAASAVYALRWLHDHRIAHGFVNAQSVWFSKSSFRFSDFCITRHIFQLCAIFKSKIEGRVPFVSSCNSASTTKDLVDLGDLLDGFMLRMKPKQCSENLLTQLSCFISTCHKVGNVELLIYHPFLTHGLATLQSGNTLSSFHILQQNTRLSKEFVIMRFIGKGAFGDVLQARNKLDCNDYAIKCIALSHGSERLSREITREVKLFAKLNHINVVRYFSAWVESVTTTKPSAGEKKTSYNDSFHGNASNTEGNSIFPSKLRNIYEAAKYISVETSEWTASCQEEELCEASFQEISSDDSNGLHGNSRLSTHEQIYSDVDILFQNDEDKSDGICASRGGLGALGPSSRIISEKRRGDKCSPISHFRVLFIQMEYCEGGTLRKFIDSHRFVGNAYLIWRIFGEILSGLGYIHRQGMIHRDIKPMNILIDGKEHVKIGDFGLATRDLFLKGDAKHTSKTGTQDSGLTRDIGTRLYMAPELTDANNLEPYTCKIDVYSLGIVLFEMCYRPISTEMERISVISKLKELDQLPDDFEYYLKPAQAKFARNLVLRMLKQNAHERPTTEHLLKNDQIPLLDVEDKHFQLQFQQVLNKQDSRLYKWVMEAICRKEHSIARCFCFDHDICKEKFSNGRDQLLERLREDLIPILRLHAFAPLHNHLLVPNSSKAHVYAENMCAKPAIYFSSSGYSVMLPVDLRQNFVRYCARNSINRIKRYTFDRVYSESDDAGGLHPTERWQCSVDCIGSTASSMTLTINLLNVALEITSKTLADYRCSLRIGHIGIIEAAMRHVGMNSDIRASVLQVLHDVETSPGHVTSTRLDALEKIIGEKASRNFLTLLPKEQTISAFKKSCKIFMCSKDDAVRESSRTALAELEQIAELLLNDTECSTIVMFDASTVYCPSTFTTGLVFRVTCLMPTRKQVAPQSVSVLAGGRYDDMLRQELHPHDIRPTHPLCLVGFSIFLDTLADMREKILSDFPSICNALVCSYGEVILTEKFYLAKLLRDADISTDILHHPVDDIHQLLGCTYLFSSIY